MRSTPVAILVLGLSLAACGGTGSGDDDDDGAGGDAAPDDGRPAVDGNTDGGAMEVPGSLHFFGTGTDGVDRVEIAIDPAVPADVGAGDFTIDFWLRIPPNTTLPAMCMPGKDNWQAGNVVLDRDRAGNGDRGEYGIAVFATGVAVGVNQGATGNGFCGIKPVSSGWHHVAVTRNATTGIIALYVDGVPDGNNQGPTGDVSYRDGATGAAKDPFLVLGGRKDNLPGHAFEGFVDELRVSTTVRYTAMFTPETAPHAVDADTAALYHFDDGSGTLLSDARAGLSPGQIKVGTGVTGGPVPIWSIAEPFIR